MKLYIFFVTFCVFGSSFSEKTYKIKFLESSSGLHADPISKLVFAKDDLQLGVYVDVTPFDYQYKNLTRSYEILEELCKTRECKSFERTTFLYNMFLDKVETMGKNFRGTKSVHTITGPPIKEEEAIEIMQTIDKYESEEKSDQLKGMMLSKASINYRNESFLQFERLKTLNDEYLEVVKDLLQNKDKNETDPETYNDIEEYLHTVNLCTLYLNNIMMWLIESMNYAENELLHPEVMNAEQFLRELIKASSHLPKSMRFPYPLTSENTHNLKHLIDINAFLYNMRLVFILSVPLVEDTTYDLYNLLPLPMEISKGKFVYIQPSTDSIAISEDLKQYASMDNLRHCTKLDKQLLMCKSVSVYSMEHRPICETELIAGKKEIPESCDTRVVVNNLNIWHKLHSGNTWLFVKYQPEEISVNCLNQEPVDVEVSITGLLTLNSECVVSTDYIKLEFDDPDSNLTDVLMNADITKDACCNKEAVADTLKDHDVFTEKLSNINLNNIDRISYKIKNSLNNNV